MEVARAWLRLLCGTCEPGRRYSGIRPRKGDPQAAGTARGRVPKRGPGSDRPIVVMRPGNAGVNRHEARNGGVRHRRVSDPGGPESCVGVREGAGEALTGVRAGRAMEPRNQFNWGADAVWVSGRQHRWRRYARVARGPRAVREPGHVRKLHAREPGEPMLARLHDRGTGRSGKAKATSPR